MTNRKNRGRMGRAGAGLLLGLIAGIAMVFPSRDAEAIWVFFTQKEAIEMAFPNGEEVNRVSWKQLSKEKKREIEAAVGQTIVFNLTRCFQGSKDGKVTGYACIDNVIGRSRPITYMVKINHPAGDLAFYEVLVYRESIGKEVGGGPFREQFYGKTIDDPLEYGNDIRNFAGATFSAVSLRNGFRRLFILYHRYLKSLPSLARQ